MTAEELKELHNFRKIKRVAYHLRQALINFRDIRDEDDDFNAAILIRHGVKPPCLGTIGHNRDLTKQINNIDEVLKVLSITFEEAKAPPENVDERKAQNEYIWEQNALEGHNGKNKKINRLCAGIRSIEEYSVQELINIIAILEYDISSVRNDIERMKEEQDND